MIFYTMVYPEVPMYEQLTPAKLLEKNFVHHIPQHAIHQLELQSTIMSFNNDLRQQQPPQNYLEYHPKEADLTVNASSDANQHPLLSFPPRKFQSLDQKVCNVDCITGSFPITDPHIANLAMHPLSVGECPYVSKGH